MGSLNWKKAKKYNAKADVSDERAYMAKDPAARFIQKAEADRAAQRASQKKGNKDWKKRAENRAARQPAQAISSDFQIYTDGACEPNPGRGGWGMVVFSRGRAIHEDKGGEDFTTNNIMEMTAILKALEWIKDTMPVGDVVIYSDSQYCVNACNTWRFAWRARGWVKKARGCAPQPVKNKELWIEIDKALSSVRAKVVWIKGHAGNRGNELADKLSRQGRQSLPSDAIIDQLTDHSTGMFIL